MNYPKIKIIAKEEASSDTFVVDRDLLIPIDSDCEPLRGLTHNAMVEPRRGGCLDGHGFYLIEVYDWKIVRDDRGSLVLVPLKKP
jgi:hypothetical protein